MPKVLTDAQRIEVEALAAYLSAGQMADYFGVCRTTFFALLKRDKDAGERYKRGKSKAIGKVAQGLVQRAVAGDTASSIFFSAWSMLKLAAFWRGGNSLKVAKKSPTYFWAGISRKAWSIIQSQ